MNVISTFHIIDSGSSHTNFLFLKKEKDAIR